MRVSIKVHARARRTRLAGKLGDGWKLEIAAPPVEGRANRAIVAFFSEAFRLPRSAVRIAAGERSSRKVVEITGINEEQFRRFAEGAAMKNEE